MELGEWMPTQAGCSCSAHHALLDPAAILDISCAAASPLQIARRELAWHNGVLMALEQRTQQQYSGSCNSGYQLRRDQPIWIARCGVAHATRRAHCISAAHAAAQQRLCTADKRAMRWDSRRILGGFVAATAFGLEPIRLTEATEATHFNRQCAGSSDGVLALLCSPCGITCYVAFVLFCSPSL